MNESMAADELIMKPAIPHGRRRYNGSEGHVADDAQETQVNDEHVPKHHRQPDEMEYFAAATPRIVDHETP